MSINKQFIYTIGALTFYYKQTVKHLNFTGSVLNLKFKSLIWNLVKKENDAKNAEAKAFLWGYTSLLWNYKLDNYLSLYISLDIIISWWLCTTVPLLLKQVNLNVVSGYTFAITLETEKVDLFVLLVVFPDMYIMLW